MRWRVQYLTTCSGRLSAAKTGWSGSEAYCGKYSFTSASDSRNASTSLSLGSFFDSTISQPWRGQQFFLLPICAQNLPADPGNDWSHDVLDERAEFFGDFAPLFLRLDA